MRNLTSLLLLLAWAGAAPGQVPLAPAQAQALVSRALASEVRASQDANHPMHYRLRRSSPRITSTKEIVESRDGDVARLVAINDQPLSQADEQREQARLDMLLSDPGRQRHRKQSEESDTRIVLKLLRMLPQAFTYEYAGTDGKAVKYRFRPNPGFTPPDYETQALIAMSGELWIDADAERVTRLEGHLQQDTEYGWGVLGRLNKGGWIVIEQADMGAGQWRIVRFKMKMELRVLFKTRLFDTTQEMNQYAPVAVGLDYRQAIQMLRSGGGR
jgi:hypothetical protein